MWATYSKALAGWYRTVSGWVTWHWSKGARGTGRWERDVRLVLVLPDWAV